MKSLSLILILLSHSIYAAKIVTINEKLEKHFKKPDVDKIRFTLAEEIICHYMDLCDHSHYVKSGLTEEVIIRTKTYSEKIKKQVTLMRLEVFLSELETKCLIDMKLKPQNLSISPEGDFEETKSYWKVRDLNCQENQ